MIAVFADTYYWLALINPRDHAHLAAITPAESLAERIVTTTWILAEVGDAMCDPANRPAFLQLLKDIANDPLTTVVPAEQNWFDRAVVLFAARLDKKWSLTDCISFVVMKELGLMEALTGDVHFAQTGFRNLMA